ncbi:Trs120-domain-containing protein [Phellopilus nigrolimitatus]|nr:Trs120-domain-containing protein [Phellopilus nigrolimitatus]
MDQAFASLAHIRILVLPVGSIQRSSFEEWSAMVRDFDEIRLSDVPGDSRDDKARFMPNPLATGSLLLNYATHPPSPSRSGLDLFRPSDFVLGVVGIASCSQSDALSSIYSQFNGSLAELFPSSPMFPLSQNCLVFEEGNGNTNLNVGNHMPGLVVIPSMMGNKKLYIGTLLAELCSNILGEFSIMVKALESPSGSESLNTGIFARLPDYKNVRTSLDGHEGYRSPHNMEALHSFPEILGSSSTFRNNDPSKLPLKRASTLGPGIVGANNRNSTLLIPSTKKRQSGVSAGTAHARLYKVLGDLFLLAGRIMDASIWYNEAVHHLKQPQDMPWQAAALEGIAVASVIDFCSANHGLSSGSSQVKDPCMEFSEKFSRATALYSGAADVADSEQCMSDLSFLYITACLRQSSLLYSVWLARGWNPLTFRALLHGKFGIRPSPQSKAEETVTVAHPDQLSITTGVSRSDISAILAQAHGPWLLHLGSRERIEALRCIAVLYSGLRYRRKEAYILRELLACLMDLVILGREEIRESTETSLDIHEASNPQNGHENVGIREKDDVAGNNSILQLVKYICEVHSIDLDAVKFYDEDTRTAGQSRISSSQFHPSKPTSATFTSRYSWPDLQTGMAREALAVAEALPDYPAVILFALSALRSLSSFLDAEDQYHLYTTASRAMATVRRRGDERKLNYWLAEIVVSIDLVPLPFIRLPRERSWSDLQLQSGGDHEQHVKIDPFLYNPRRILNGKRQAIAVANEELEFSVTLENPYSVVLDLLSVSLSTTGVSFVCNPSPVMIQPNSFETVTLTGRTTESGTLIIRGCIVQLPGLERHEALLPSRTDEEEEKHFLKSIAQLNEDERSKSLSLNDRLVKRRYTHDSNVPLEKDSKPIAPLKYLELKIVPEQPFLRIRRTSLTNGAVMLYDGEYSIIRLTVENISSLPVDYLDLLFDDSTKVYSEQALNDSDLNAFDIYETEYSLVNRPVFSWESDKSRKEIAAGKESAIFVKCFGKVGCTDGTIQISYSYTSRRQDNLQTPPTAFYTRQLLFPVLVTVYQMLNCSGMNILPISTLELGDTDVVDKDWSAFLKNANEFEWCVLTLDVQNIYGLPFEVILSYRSKVSTTRVVPPGSTYRFLLPIERFSLSTSETTAPIPSLMNRQFVVTGLASDEEKAQGELFWYREELLSRVHATWKEAAGSRMGELSLRQQRFTQPMLNALRTENIRVCLSLSVIDDGEESAISSIKLVGSSGMTYMTAPNRYVLVTTRVQNLSPSPLVLSLTLNGEPAEYFAYNGVLKNIPIGRLMSQESKEHQALVVFLAQGQFTISAQVRTVVVGQQAEVSGTGSLVVMSQDS